MKHKIFSHTSLLIILSVVLTFLAAGTVMYNRYDIYMKQGVRDEAAYIKTGLEEDGRDFLTDKIGDATSSRITLLGKDGDVLFDSIENPSEMENHSNRPEFIEAEKKGFGEMVRYSDTLSKQTFYYAIKLKDDQVLRVARTTHRQSFDDYVIQFSTAWRTGMCDLCDRVFSGTEPDTKAHRTD